jgi:hypothetical protein
MKSFQEISSLPQCGSSATSPSENSMGSQVDIFIEQNLIESFQEKVYPDKDLSIFLINLDEIGDWTQSTKCFTESISKSSERKETYQETIQVSDDVHVTYAEFHALVLEKLVK